MPISKNAIELDINRSKEQNIEKVSAILNKELVEPMEKESSVDEDMVLHVYDIDKDILNVHDIGYVSFTNEGSNIIGIDYKMPSVVKYMKEKNTMNEKNTGHTLISFILNTLAIIVMLYIGIRYINDPDPISVAFAQYAFVMAGFATLGFFAIDYFDNRQINIKPKKFNEFNTTRFVVTVGGLFLASVYIDFILKVTIRYALADIDQVLYYVSKEVLNKNHQI